MCAPLWKGDAVIGIIHVDTPVQVNSFTKADLELLSALANYAAVAIEQARLNQKIRDERFARERLEKYFSPSVVARILSEGEKEAQELEATILFADIVGFTRLAERMTPPAVAGAGAIVVGERTFELVKEVFVLGDLGRVALEGKEEGIQAYEVLAERKLSSPYETA